ncbi:uncharacterized protein LOC123196831 isoform X2 [Mangifera indica]|uniref:uncharacterized protein LOC123196831 isoform X2 n=1 Tax=Mangifera indica TaxID=29780 RepID=UPI001CFAADA3|nr:uncharacterized protein LOC123196831 isoform X2 [Mangifera indica]
MEVIQVEEEDQILEIISNITCPRWTLLLVSPSSMVSRENNKERTPPRHSYSNILDSFESLRIKSSPQKVSPAARPVQKVSPAMSTLQNYYGLKPQNHKGASEDMEMAVYRTRSSSSDYLNEELLAETSPMSDLFSIRHQEPRQADGFVHENGAMSDYVPLAEAGESEGEKSNEKSVRRRQKAEADTPERLLKEENGGGSNGFSSVTGKGLAMRPKSASRIALATDSESGWLNTIPVGLGDSVITDGPVGVRKSSSTPSFQDQDSSSSSIWPTSKWSLKPDLQALSTAAAITRPLLNGLPKPVTGRRGKAALD